MRSRLPADDEACGTSIHEGDCFVISDGCKEGNNGFVMNAFVDVDGRSLPKTAKKLALFFFTRTRLSREAN